MSSARRWRSAAGRFGRAERLEVGPGRGGLAGAVAAGVPGGRDLLRALRGGAIRAACPAPRRAAVRWGLKGQRYDAAPILIMGRLKVHR